jgi:cellulose synthase/poly-beta-1,6-N-acetylglucosamine synthase-like glycosyltransferase
VIIIFLRTLVEIAAVLMLVPVVVFSAEILVASTIGRKSSAQGGGRGRIAVLMPAHNEAAIIAATLRSVRPQLDQCDRVVVVADNCSDDTAAIASAAGAQVVDRSDLSLRGKGYALDAGVRYLEGDAPDAVIIIDADCQITAGAIDQLARECARTERPVQALYLMHTAKEPTFMARIAEFAWVIKNQARPTGLQRMGFPCQLMGTGMAIPWSCIKSVNLASGHIAEDLRLGIDLARAGKAPLFCPGAVVTSTFSRSLAGQRGQRTRWEHGHLSLILSEAPRLFFHSIAKRDRNSFALGLDLSVPPLGLLTLLVAAVWLASAGLCLIVRTDAPLIIATTAAALLVLSTLLAWGRFGRHIISITDLAFAPIYALWKLPIYAKFLMARQLDWVRAKRDNDES